MKKEFSNLRPSCKLLAQALFGMPDTELLSVDKVSNSALFIIKGKAVFIRGIHTPLNTQSACQLANDKVASNQALSYLGLSVPDSVAYVKGTKVSEVKPALLKFLQKHKNIIAKPINGLKSIHVYMNIQNMNDALYAYEQIMASSFSGILYQKQITGSVYRLLFVQGRLVSALKREPGYVIGNGIDTLSALVEAINRLADERKRSFYPIDINETGIKRLISDQGFSPDSIIPSGHSCVIQTDTSNYETLTEVSTNINRNLSRKIGDSLVSMGLGLCGVDAISTNIEEELSTFVLEINKEPSLAIHQYPDFGEVIDVPAIVARAIWDIS